MQTLATHPAQIPHPAFQAIGRKKRMGIGRRMGAERFPSSGIRHSRDIHEISTLFKSRSDAVVH